MDNREKIIRAIEKAKRQSEEYAQDTIIVPFREVDMIIALLKEQEAARVMTLDELKEIYVEFKGDDCPIRLTNFDLQKIIMYAVDGDCRLWMGKPTNEQRKAVKWDD